MQQRRDGRDGLVVKTSLKASVLLLGLPLVLAGCPDPRGDGWQQVKVLEARVAQLEKELGECRNGPGLLLGSARAAFDKGDYTTAVAEARNLMAAHPRTPEAATAAEIIRQVESLQAEAAARQAAEAASIAQAREQAMAQALRNLVKKVDNVSGVTYYRHKSAPDYLNARSVLAPYIAVDRGGRAHLMLRNVYVGKEMLGIDAFIVQADGRTFELDDTVSRDSDDVSAWEWSEGAASSMHVAMLGAVAAAKSAVVRYNGAQAVQDRTIPAAEKALIGDVLAAYEALSGK